MLKIITALLMIFLMLPVNSFGLGKGTDIIQTSEGDLEITIVGHGTLMFSFGGKIIHVDPWSRLADYSNMPKADLILITHTHPDHLDTKTIKHIRTDNTVVVHNEACAVFIENGITMKNRDSGEYAGFKIDAVPAYNIVMVTYHPKGNGNGYIITFGDKRVYVAGDTENTPEMKALKDIDIAFLPMNQPYTMKPEMIVDAVKAFRPKILYPYHYDGSYIPQLLELIKDEKDIDVRIR